MVRSPVLEKNLIISPYIGRVICFIAGFPAFFARLARDVYGKDSAAAVGLRVYREKTAAIRAGADRFLLDFDYLVRIVEDPALPLEQLALLAVVFPNAGALLPDFERFLYDYFGCAA